MAKRTDRVRRLLSTAVSEMPLSRTDDAMRKRTLREEGTVVDMRDKRVRRDMRDKRVRRDKRDRPDKRDEGKEAARKQKSYYEKKAKQGNTNAQFKLGCIYWEGSDAVKKYIPMATTWLNMAAEKGHPGAQKIMIDNGLEITTGGKDKERSTAYLPAVLPESSSAMNDAGACAKLARQMDADAASSEKGKDACCGVKKARKINANEAHIADSYIVIRAAEIAERRAVVDANNNN